jgi:hypothetical protein
MSAAPTTTTKAPAAQPAGADGRTALLGWIAVIATFAVIAVMVAVAVWPASEADKARADGKQLGEAVVKLYNAQSSADVDAALADIQAAVADTRDHAGDAIANQVADQQDALARAVDGFVGSNTTGDAFEAELYQAELNVALDDLTRQVDDFRTTGPEVQQAYWDGFQEGLPGD